MSLDFAPGARTLNGKVSTLAILFFVCNHENVLFRGQMISFVNKLLRKFGTAFVDHAEIIVQAGKGGRGAVSFARAKHKRVGPPDGGHGGTGGSVVIEANSGIRSLQGIPFHHFASNGLPGGGDQCNGKSGADKVVYVPTGTVVLDKATGEVVADLAVHGDRVAVAVGGRGGAGNKAFVSGSCRSPRTAIDGIKGERKSLVLDLHTLAQVGLVGFPNAGKSALLGALTLSKPKVADYPFTTLQPWVGFLERSDFREPVTIADIPGLVEGAHENRGLGHRFLRHIQRTDCLIYVLDATDADVRGKFRALLDELGQFDASLVSRKRIIVGTKADLLEPDSIARTISSLAELDAQVPVHLVSSHTRYGLSQLRNTIERLVVPETRPDSHSELETTVRNREETPGMVAIS